MPDEMLYSAMRELRDRVDTIERGLEVYRGIATGAVPFTAASGRLTSATEFAWDNATKRLTLTGTLTVTGTTNSIGVEAVIAPTLLNSWVNYGSGYEAAGYWKDPMGYVNLRGLVRSGVGDLFVLPVGYRPTSALIFATVANDAFGRITINSAGQVQFSVGSNAFVSLSGIRFRV